MMAHSRMKNGMVSYTMDLDSLKPETEEPLMFQIAEQVYSAVEKVN